MHSNSYTFICAFLTLPAASHFNEAEVLNNSDSEAVVQDLESTENVKEEEIPLSRHRGLRRCNYWATRDHKCNQYERCSKDGYCVVRRKYMNDYTNSYDGSGKKSELILILEYT